MQVTMEQLVAKAVAGDKAAENEVFQRLRVRFVQFAKRKMQNTDAAEDLAQEACMTILQKYSNEKFTVGFQAWAYGVLKKKIGNYLQERAVRQRTMRSANGTQLSVEAQACWGREEDPHTLMRLRDCMRKLIRARPRYSRVLNLIHQGYKTDEVCRRMDIKASNCYKILSRGRDLLELCLETGRI